VRQGSIVAAKVSVPENATGAGIAAAIDDAETRIRAAVPLTCVIYIEPDILGVSATLPNTE
jgi:hypothetical protein